MFVKTTLLSTWKLSGVQETLSADKAVTTDVFSPENSVSFQQPNLETWENISKQSKFLMAFKLFSAKQVYQFVTEKHNRKCPSVKNREGRNKRHFAKISLKNYSVKMLKIAQVKALPKCKFEIFPDFTIPGIDKQNPGLPGTNFKRPVHST